MLALISTMSVALGQRCFGNILNGLADRPKSQKAAGQEETIRDGGAFAEADL